jgi:flagellar basal body-associated protein FliL
MHLVLKEKYHRTESIIIIIIIIIIAVVVLGVGVFQSLQGYYTTFWKNYFCKRQAFLAPPPPPRAF